MKSSIDHLPPPKQRELRKAVDLLLEEFDDAVKGGTSDFKKRGRILKVILFGSYARGGWVDEPHTRKGYRSDFDLLVVVNNRKLTDFASYWQTAADRLMREVNTPVSFIVHSRREVNTALREGQYFFVDIRRDGIVLYELDEEPLANPVSANMTEAVRLATEYFHDRLPHAKKFVKGAIFFVHEKDYKEAAFLLHQSIEQAYAALLLVLTNYSPASHNIKFLRSLAEDQAQELAEVWPRDQQRFVSWFNVINEAYVKARYSRHFEITEEALHWLSERVSDLIDRTEDICRTQLARLQEEADKTTRRS
ncbi:HEPN domain-containing protein [Mesorhizobium sp. M3A.F.Ca.ET.080.04.2.1]|uniref:nucleotidyltransferase and HEPN domain-containing protein n=1 Tax=Mesorhizobium sp. M3A.F.Ca.ET.080.04.2.1 TaxID=2493676 RepID=UPI000F7607D9|nr:nucleotidyltransferase and HEPN domain-containing protein [Mesorhizobium sp. M3A.F.Ca.ET.080.04.2.1]AZO07940.1 HEPN domain-containing protein [Mesorhizobium sp. M3A.F.Ca.ET.080.04.2.1]RWF18408.1 MAG: HEPN domain-containing protein [Mesorhizobium sp.]